jgi:hypothetical protein
MKTRTAWTIALAIVTPILWWGAYRTFKPFRLSDLSGYDWSMVRFTVKPGYPDFAEGGGVKTMTVILFYPTDDRASLRSKARAVCLRCAAEMRRLLPNDHRAVKLTLYRASEAQVEARHPKDPRGSAGDLTIDDPTREAGIPDPKEEWH